MSNKIKKFPKKFTIGFLVINTILSNPNIKNEDLIKLVKSKFPESKFQKTHISWYKYQLKNKLYKIPEKV